MYERHLLPGKVSRSHGCLYVAFAGSEISFNDYEILISDNHGCLQWVAQEGGKVQSTLVTSTSVISNNRLSRRKNLVLVITQKSKIRL